MIPSSSQHELIETERPPQPISFDATIAELFAIAETAQNTIDHEIYGQVEWDVEQPNKLANVLVVNLQPTGARRQLVRNKFSRGQFKVNVLYDNKDEAVEKYIWCSVDPQPVGESLVIDQAKLDDEYSLISLTPLNIIKILADRVAKVEDYVSLMQVMRDKQIDSYPELDTKIRQTVYDLINGDILSPTKSTSSSEAKEKVFELIANFSDVSPDATKRIISRMTTLLLRDLHGNWGIARATDPSSAQQSVAKSTLEAAIRQGVIPSGSPAIERVLSHESFYRYHSGVDMLYDELCQNPRTTANNIFDVGRLNFAHDFMLGVIDGRLKTGANPNLSASQRQGINYALSRTGIARFLDKRADNSLSSYYDIADLILSDDLQPADVKTKQARRSINYLLANFLQVLDVLSPGDVESQAEYEELNRKSNEILQTVLYPVALSKMGKLAVAERVL